MPDLVAEINSLGITCYGMREGIPVTDELSPTDQNIVNAAVACSGQPFTSAEKTALWGLLTAQQQDDYTAERNKQILDLRYIALSDQESDWILRMYLADNLEKKDWTDDVEAVEAQYPLWSDT